MVNSGHDVRTSKNGRNFTCKRCGLVAESRNDRGFSKACAADLYENRIDGSHKMKFTTNSNHPDSNDIRVCTKCGKTSFRVDSMFASLCN